MPGSRDLVIQEDDDIGGQGTGGGVGGAGGEGGGFGGHVSRVLCGSPAWSSKALSKVACTMIKEMIQQKDELPQGFRALIRRLDPEEEAE